MEEIEERFNAIKDPRHQSYVTYRLSEILVPVMCAVICGITELADMMVYFENKAAFFLEQFGIAQIPSKPTFSRMINLLDADAVGMVIVDIMRSNAKEIGDVIAADGKAIRSTGEDGKPHSFLQILTVYATESGVTLGQESIAHKDKTNEIPVFQAMLDTLDIKGKTITADPMHCQKETCRKIIKKQGNYAFGLKANQANLHSDVRLFFESPVNSQDCSTFETIEKNGGRIEKRKCVSTDKIEWLADRQLWPGLKTIYAITRTVTKKGATTTETGYYISSLPNDPENLLRVTRSHWMIESMHWSLDAIWHEDVSAIRSDNGNKTLNAMRKLALLAHKRFVDSLPKKRSVKSNVLSALVNEDVCLAVLAFL
jgi:predicted transposase YbfD/YdcC